MTGANQLDAHWRSVFYHHASRVPAVAWRAAIIVLSLVVAACVVGRGWPTRLAVDIGGGNALVYQVQGAEGRTANYPVMAKIVGHIQ